MGITLRPRTGCWIRYQLDLRNLTYDTVAKKAGVHASMVTHFLRCRKNSERVNSNSKFQFLGAKTADSVGFATKMSLFLSFFLEGKSKRRVK